MKEIGSIISTFLSQSCPQTTLIQLEVDHLYLAILIVLVSNRLLYLSFTMEERMWKSIAARGRLYDVNEMSPFGQQTQGIIILRNVAVQGTKEKFC